MAAPAMRSSDLHKPARRGAGAFQGANSLRGKESGCGPRGR